MLLAAALFPAAAFGQGGPRIVSGAGLVDYRHPEQLKTGMWTRYIIRETGGGVTEESQQMVSVAGFDTLGSEKGVWIETEYKDSGGVPRYCKTFVSLSIVGADSGRGTFQEVVPEYARRVLSMDRPGAQIEELNMPVVVNMSRKARPNPNAQTELTEQRDSLPSTEVVTVAGKFQCIPDRRRRDFRAVVNSNGVRRLHEQHEEIVAYRSDAVPLTHIVRQTHKISTRDSVIPQGAPDTWQPPFPFAVSLREAILIKDGLDAKSAFPADAKTVPFGRPPASPEDTTRQR